MDFDLLELDGKDLRHTPIEERKGTLAKLLGHPHEGIALNQHSSGDGAIIFKHACSLGCEGIVSKRLGSPYRSGRADCWVKVKNPEAPAVKLNAPCRLLLRRDALLKAFAGHPYALIRKPLTMIFIHVAISF